MKIQSPFSKYISGEAVESIAPNNPFSLEAKNTTVSFILIQVKDDNLDELEQLITTVCDIVLQRDFMVASVVSSLIVATVGFPMKGVQNPLQNCKQLADDLAVSHRGKLKVVYGSLAGKYGTFGHPKIKKFGPVLPGFGSLLKQVTDLEYGSIRQV